MRKNFIDNIRWITVLFLFPYHTARIFDSFTPFYVKGTASQTADTFILSCTPWFMPILFVLAGISTRYALQKRSNRQYIRERFEKLLVPLFFGILLLIPVQTYYAERFFNGYTGNYAKQYLLFFTKIEDLTGYSGGFTPGQLWFICYLFLISMVALPILNVIRKRELRWKGPGLALIPLCIITFLLSFVLDISGKSLGEYFSLFLLGYFVLAEEEVQEYLDHKRVILAIAGVALTVFAVASQMLLRGDVIGKGILIFTSWMDILAILGMGRHYLNFQNKWARYLSGSSFACYLFHQSWIVLIGFYILQCDLPVGAAYILILAGSFLGSICTYEICKRIPVLRFMFAIKASGSHAPSERKC